MIAHVDKPQHRLDEIIAIGTVHPRGPQHERGRTSATDGPFTFELRTAIDTERDSCILFSVGKRFSAVEHVVRGNLDQWHAQPLRFNSEALRSIAIDRESSTGLEFGSVDGGVGGSVHHRAWF